MKLITTFLLITMISLNGYTVGFEKYLLQVPQLILEKGQAENECYTVDESKKIEGLVKSVERVNVEGKLEVWHSFIKKTTIIFTVDTTIDKSQAYFLNITPQTISILGQSQAALFYGKQTLLQLLSYSITEKKPLPSLQIEDWPNFERRGYMLDISRDKVPTMQTLFQVIDMLAMLKINELQLYTEHTFAYKNHKVVWENAGALTPEEVKQLDSYCHERFIDLVPNQNSFGHMENWLKHDEYLHLAECPDECKTVWGMSKRKSLDPTNPKSFELMQELYGELLPNFNSEFFNINCDETMELGKGRSKEECDKHGVGKVYLDYLTRLNSEVNKHGKLAQFWGDIILNHPELIAELPKNMTAMVWGYSATYPFEKNLKGFKKSGLDFYVCPGTSTWRSLVGRNYNAFKNLKNAATEGYKNGAKGFLTTDWGDYGHWQPLSVSYPSIIIGAAYSWNYDDAALKNLEFQINHYVFKDKTGNTAKALLMLGNAYLKTDIPAGNANAFHLMLRRYMWTMKGQYQTKHLNIDGLEKAETEIRKALEVLDGASPQNNNSAIVKQELELAANIAMHGIHLGIERLKAKGYATENIPDSKKKELYTELKPLIEKHKELWIIRNREGGLKDSAEKLEGLLNYYQ